MKYFLVHTLSLCAILHIPVVASMPYPTLQSTIQTCSTPRDGLVCSRLVHYQSIMTEWADIIPVGKPRSDLSLTVEAVGVHCKYGDLVNGVPFSGCYWERGAYHAPLTFSCKLKSADSWEFTSDSNCNTFIYWGGDPDAGAGPGAECVVFGQRPNTVRPATLHTIYGDLDATVVARSNNNFCIKPIQSFITCNVGLPSTISHGTVEPNSMSSAYVEGSIDCGPKPVVEILGGGLVPLGPGITTKIVPKLTSSSTIRVTSELTAVAATPGFYKSAFIVVVSPR